MKLLSAFPLSMIPSGKWDVRCQRIPFNHVESYLGDPEPIIEDEDKARVLSEVLDDTRIVVNRAKVILEPYESMIVAEFTDENLPIGATTLPVGTIITWWLITMHSVV